MQMKIMWFGAIFFGGWIWSYFFFRQFIFNILVANPLTKKMLDADGNLVGAGAKKYTNISTGVCILFMLIAIFVVLRFCALYLIIGFFIGFISGAIMVWLRTKPTNKNMFDNFCATYYRFIPDDELRTAMFNKKPSQMKSRLRSMGITADIIPEFDKA